MTETKKRDWGWLGYVGTALFGAAVAVIIMLSCGKKDTPEGALIYERSLDGRVVNLWIKGINGIAQKIEYKEVKPDTEYLLDTVYFPLDTISHYAITSVTLLPNPLTSFIRSRDTLGYARETQFLTSPNMLGGTYDIRIDTTGKVTWYEAPINLQPKTKRTVLSVGISGGVQYGQVDTLWRVAPRFETYFQYSPWDFLKLRLGLGYPWGAFATATWEIPVAKEK